MKRITAILCNVAAGRCALKRTALALLAAIFMGAGLVGVAGVPAAVAATHPTYPLGKAKSCRAHYVKRTERHKVKGKEVRYVACVYVAPPTTTTLPPTTTTTLPAIQATVVMNIYDSELFSDALAFSFDGLPEAADGIYALPNHLVTLEAFVSEPGSTGTTTGTATFYVNDQLVPDCVDIAVATNATPTQSEATCSYEFTASGEILVGATFSGTDGSRGSQETYLSIASPDQVSAIDQECAVAQSKTIPC